MSTIAFVVRSGLLSLALSILSAPDLRAAVHFSEDVPVPIPDNGPPASATVEVSGEADAVFSVNVAANIRHRFRFDLEIFLIAPDGSTHLLREAGHSFANGPALFVGVDFPAGIDPNGTWRLEAQDKTAEDAGEILGFSIEVPASSNSSEPYVGFLFDPILTRRFVIADEAGRFGALATFRTARSGRIKGVTTIEIFSARLGESVKFFYRNDGSVALMKSVRGKVGFSKPNGGAIRMKVRLKRSRAIQGTTEVGEGHYAAFADLQQTALRLGLISFNEILSDNPTLYRDNAADFIRAVARAASHAIGVLSAKFSVEADQALQKDTAIVGALVAAVDAALDLDTGGPDSFFLVNPIASDLAADDSFRNLIETSQSDTLAPLATGLNLAAQTYPSLGKATPPLLYTFNETLSVTDGSDTVEALLFNPYADGRSEPALNFAWSHGSEADNSQLFDRIGPIFATDFVSGEGSTILPLTGRERYLFVTTSSEAGPATFSYMVFGSF